MRSRPVLHIGFELPNGLSVTNRIEKVFFTEVYLLSNSSYLYLFLNLDSSYITSRGEKYDLLKIQQEGREYVGIIVSTHSAELVSQILEEFVTERGFDRVAGMEELKTILTRDVIEPLKHPEKFEEYKLSIPNGILLYGAPGTGKTFIVRQLAEELNYYFLELKHSDVGSSYMHGTTGKIRQYFDKAFAKAPAIVFIDELSGLVPKRETLASSFSYKEEEVNEFLTQLDNAADRQVLVIGATNYPDRIDPAALRSGRMDKRIYVPPPDFKAREELFKLFLSGRPTEENNIDFGKLAELTQNFVSSDIELVVDNAARTALAREQKIDHNILEKEIDIFTPSISAEELSYFQSFRRLERW